MSSPFDPPWVTVVTGRAQLEHFLSSEVERQAAGALELRLDLWDLGSTIERQTLTALKVHLAQWTRPVIFTWRCTSELPVPHSPLRNELFQEIARGGWGSAWVDLDLNAPSDREALRFLVGSRRVIASRHASEALTDARAREHLDRGFESGAAAVKLVLAENGLSSVRQALRVAVADHALHHRPICVLASGLEGAASRTLTTVGRYGWAYGRLQGCPGVDPGQPATARLAERIGSSSECVPRSGFAVLGARVERSISPSFHNGLLRSLGRPELFLDLSLATPDGVLAPDSDFEFLGLAVTTPHKHWARSVADPGIPSCERYPAWNTLLRSHASGRWLGWNTDAPAIRDLLEQRGLEVGERVLVLGAGGVAIPAAIELRDAGFDPRIVARTVARARRVETEHALSAAVDVIPDGVAIVNATGVDDPQIPGLQKLRRSGAVRMALEARYLPNETVFLEQWRASGAAPIHGVEVFAEQARRQAEILYGYQGDRAQCMARAHQALTAELQDER